MKASKSECRQAPFPFLAKKARRIKVGERRRPQTALRQRRMKACTSRRMKLVEDRQRQAVADAHPQVIAGRRRQPPPLTPPSQAKASRRTSLTPPQALQASHCPRSSAGVGVRWGVRGQCCARSAWWRAASSSADSPQAKADVGRRKQATAPSEGRKMGEGRHPHSDEGRRAQKMADSPRHGQRRMKADASRR